MSVFVVLFVFTIFLAFASFYVFCLSPPAVRVADTILYDPLEDSLCRYGGNEE